MTRILLTIFALLAALPGLAAPLGDDGLHLGRALELQEQAGMDEDRARVDDKGVEAPVLDHEDAGLPGGQPGGGQDGAGQFGQRVLDLAVAQERDGAGGQGGPDIAAAASSVAALVIPTDEEKIIAMHTARLTQ